MDKPNAAVRRDAEPTSRAFSAKKIEHGVSVPDSTFSSFFLVTRLTIMSIQVLWSVSALQLRVYDYTRHDLSRFLSSVHKLTAYNEYFRKTRKIEWG